MGTVYKETFTKPLPAGAKIIVRKGQRLAQWQDAKGKTRTAPLTAAGNRITVESGTYTAKFRDGSGIVRKVTTGCRDESAARSLLTELERRAEKVKGGILTADESAAIDQQDRPLAEHFAAFLAHQGAKGITRMQLDNTKSRLDRVAADAGFRKLADLNGTALERWLTARQGEGMGAAARNGYREACITFGNWAVKNRRLTSNPFAGVPKADAKADPRRKRRALTESELVELLDVARRRPLVDALTIRRGKRKGEGAAVLREETRRRLEWLGRERELIYKTLVLTGLRKGELASLTVGQLVLDTEPAFLVLDAADEKNREGNSIPLRADLVADLREWLADKAKAAQAAALAVATVAFDRNHRKPGNRHQGDAGGLAGHVLPLPAAVPTLPADSLVFTVPAGLVRILDRDLKLAGIPKRDERGRTVDVHAIRHTFGTLLSANGVTPRTAQACMRHSTIDLTMNVYTDPKLLDVAGAVESLPALPLGVGPKDRQADSARIAASATGTDNSTPSPLVPVLVPTTGKPCITLAILDKTTDNRGEGRKAGAVAVSAYPVKRKDPLTTAVNGPCKSGRLDLNQRPLGPEPSALARLSYAPSTSKTRQNSPRFEMVADLPFSTSSGR
jgi:integrase